LKESPSSDALNEIRTEIANLLRHFESNFLHQSDQRNQLQFANQILRDDNEALHAKVRGLEAKLSEAALLEIKAEGAKLTLHIERCLQQQTTTRSNARTIAPSTRSREQELFYTAQRDVERRRHQEDLDLLAKKLEEKESECESLKRMQNSMLGLQADLTANLASVEQRAEGLQETIDRQNKEISSLKRKGWMSWDSIDPPLYETNAEFSSSSAS